MMKSSLFIAFKPKDSVAKSKGCRVFFPILITFFYGRISALNAFY